MIRIDASILEVFEELTMTETRRQKMEDKGGKQRPFSIDLAEVAVNSHGGTPYLEASSEILSFGLEFTNPAIFILGFFSRTTRGSAVTCSAFQIELSYAQGFKVLECASRSGCRFTQWR